MTFSVPGPPRGKGRPRFTRTGHSYTPKETVAYESRIRDACKASCAKRIEGPVRIFIKAYMSIPASASKRMREDMRLNIIRPTKKPDIDNVIKAVLDALNGLAYADDKNVVYVGASKWYAEEPSLEITIEEASE